MTHFPNWPHAERFRTLDDALQFSQKPEPHLCIPVFIEVQTERGRACKVNPDYTDAPYEQEVVLNDLAKFSATAVVRKVS